MNRRKKSKTLYVLSVRGNVHAVFTTERKIEKVIEHWQKELAKRDITRPLKEGLDYKIDQVFLNPLYI